MTNAIKPTDSVDAALDRLLDEHNSTFALDDLKLLANAVPLKSGKPRLPLLSSLDITPTRHRHNEAPSVRAAVTHRRWQACGYVQGVLNVYRIDGNRCPAEADFHIGYYQTKNGQHFMAATNLYKRFGPDREPYGIAAAYQALGFKGETFYAPVKRADEVFTDYESAKLFDWLLTPPERFNKPRPRLWEIYPSQKLAFS